MQFNCVFQNRFGNSFGGWFGDSFETTLEAVLEIGLEGSFANRLASTFDSSFGSCSESSLSGSIGTLWKLYLLRIFGLASSLQRKPSRINKSHEWPGSYTMVFACAGLWGALLRAVLREPY